MVRACVRAKAGTEVLCVHSDASNDNGRLPLIVTQTFGAGKVLFMGTDGAWRWRKGVEDKYHYRFWGQVVRWMAYQRNMAKGETMRLLLLARPAAAWASRLRSRQTLWNTAANRWPKGDVIARIVAPSGRFANDPIHFAQRRMGRIHRPVRFGRTGPAQRDTLLPQTGATLDTSFFVQGAAQGTGRSTGSARSARRNRPRNPRQGDCGQQCDDIAVLIAKLARTATHVRRLQIWCHPITAASWFRCLACFGWPAKWWA